MVEIKKLVFFFVNAYVIKGEKTILFDTGCLMSKEELSQYLAENDVDPKEIDLIIISHGHFDHCMMAAAWKELTGAKILCHKNAAEYLRNGNRECAPFIFGERAKQYQPLSWMIDMYGIPPTQALTYQPFIDFMNSSVPEQIQTVEPDILMGDEDFDLHPYGIPGKLIYTPGHVNSSIALITDDRIGFTGDTIIDLHTIQPLECVYLPGTYDLHWIMDDEEAMKASTRRLLEEVDVFYGGHGEPFGREVVEPLVQKFV